MRNDETARPNIDSPIKDEDFPETVKYQRRRVIQELIETEKDYVKLLHDLVHGFLEQCKRRKEMFSEDRISKIFGNLLQIYTLHSKLLKELEASYDSNQPENSVIANAFLRNVSDFIVFKGSLIFDGFD
uniref:DH domain-containing protein n=1 Tax=Panagrolaimus sp. JU765 TaxID=591449 RepID=A0AC34RLP4_9BILA